ncbi:MAG TPA: helix-hairpin-helix domain-containing protein [Gemmatimonadaceae bacterium]|nr:helix-hairpin-helix domain-containing protein [Gemmatimonadaceae bacterium]
MRRFISSKTLAACIAVAVAACTAKSDKTQDTSLVVTGDTSMSATTGASTTPPSTGAATTGTASTTARGTQTALPNHSINLNTATDAELMTIPGMGPRMLHEFKEYRPYTSIEQFRREIGKYVDKAEVARFEQYVTIK